MIENEDQLRDAYDRLDPRHPDYEPVSDQEKEWEQRYKS